MAESTFFIDVTKYKQLLKDIGDETKNQQAITEGMQEGNIRLDQRMTYRLNAPRHSPTPSDRLRTGTGNLKNSRFVTQPQIAGNKIIVRFGSKGVVYAPIQEYGGEIKAQNSPYLVFKVGSGLAKGGKFSKGNFVKVKSVTIPERAPFRHALKDTQDDYIKGVGRQILRRWVNL